MFKLFYHAQGLILGASASAASRVPGIGPRRGHTGHVTLRFYGRGMMHFSWHDIFYGRHEDGLKAG